MYTHEKDALLRHYLNRQAVSTLGLSSEKLAPLAELVEVFDIKKMKAMLKEHNSRTNLHRNHQRFIDYLGDTAGFLPLVTLPSDIFEKLEKLRLHFPNFSEAIDYYHEQFALAQLSGHRIFYANPLLLLGPPGVGKTFFCHELARMIGTHFEMISFSGMTAGFVIGGSSPTWTEGKPGRVVESLARSKLANILTVVDECDKAGGDKRYDPLGALYSLLEKGTAATFVDEGLEMPSNCAHLVWVGTANRLDTIPEPILSRFTIIEIKRPSSAQMKNVLQSIYNNIRENNEWGSRFNEHLPTAVINKIISSELDPRNIQKELISACGKAALRYSDKKLSDIHIIPEDFEPRNVGGHQIRMGFI